MYFWPLVDDLVILKRGSHCGTCSLDLAARTKRHCPNSLSWKLYTTVSLTSEGSSARSDPLLRLLRRDSYDWGALVVETKINSDAKSNLLEDLEAA
jgi:hypothetical protein